MLLCLLVVAKMQFIFKSWGEMPWELANTCYERVERWKETDIFYKWDNFFTTFFVSLNLRQLN